MTKSEFLAALCDRLVGLPQSEIDGRVLFYSEMIDDRIEEGANEEDAIASIGSLDEIIAEILEDVPLLCIVKEKVKKKKKKALRRAKTLKIVLLAVGSPVWLPLLISAFVVVLSLYLSLWALVISLWALFASLAACGLAGIVGGLVYAILVKPIDGILLVAAGLVCSGLAIFVFLGCKAATMGTAKLAKKIVLCVKNMFVGKD